MTQYELNRLWQQHTGWPTQPHPLVAAALRAAYESGLERARAAVRGLQAQYPDPVAPNLYRLLTLLHDALDDRPAEGPARRHALYEGGQVRPDPNPPVCGTCRLWHEKPFDVYPKKGLCKVARDFCFTGRCTLQATDADTPCDIGEWREKK